MPDGIRDHGNSDASLNESGYSGLSVGTNLDKRVSSASATLSTEPSGSATDDWSPTRDDDARNSEGAASPALPTGSEPVVVVETSALSQPAESGEKAIGTSDVSDGMEHFQRLRRRLLVSTLLASSAAVPISWLLFDRSTAFSLLVGAVGGLLYLLLLARSVARLGGERRSVSKVQLLVPVVLVLASSRLPQLELVPALVGFLLYKPALLIQAYLDH